MKGGFNRRHGEHGEKLLDLRSVPAACFVAGSRSSETEVFTTEDAEGTEDFEWVFLCAAVPLR